MHMRAYIVVLFWKYYDQLGERINCSNSIATACIIVPENDVLILPSINHSIIYMHEHVQNIFKYIFSMCIWLIGIVTRFY